jgi:hypothetical protein
MTNLHYLREDLQNHHQRIIDINHWSQNDNSQHEDDHDLTDNQSKSTDESEGE